MSAWDDIVNAEPRGRYWQTRERPQQKQTPPADDWPTPKPQTDADEWAAIKAAGTQASSGAEAAFTSTKYWESEDELVQRALNRFHDHKDVTD